MNKGTKKILFWGLIGLSIILAAYLVASRYPNGLFDEPRVGTYRSDEMIFLKTYYLMEKGWNYYPAFSWAIAGDVRGIVLTSDLFQWRFPTIFYLWNVLANTGWQILFLFWVCVLTTFTAAFLVVRKFTRLLPALVVVLLLVPYFIDVFHYQTSFLFTEWWGWFFLMWGLAAYIYDKRIMAWSFWLMAIITRELLIIPVVCFLLLGLWQRRDRILFLSLLVIFGAFVTLHRNMVVHFMQGAETSAVNPLTRFHIFDKQSFMPMIAFSMRRYPLIQYKSNWVLVGLAGLSLLHAIWKRLFCSKVIYVYVAAWSLLFLLPFISTSIYNDYWGILFVPTVLITIPLLKMKI